MTDGYEHQRIHIAVKGVIINEGRALVIRRREIKNPDGRDWWEFPGGTLEFGETPEETLVREMKEETGLDVTTDKLLYVWSVMIQNYQIIIITYLCACNDTGKVELSGEHTGFMWADVNELREYLADDIKKALDANQVWKLFEQ